MHLVFHLLWWGCLRQPHHNKLKTKCNPYTSFQTCGNIQDNNAAISRQLASILRHCWLQYCANPGKLYNWWIWYFIYWDDVALKLQHYISTCWGNPGTGMFLGNQHCRNIPVRILEMLDFFSKNPTLDLNFTATLGTNIAALFPQEINVAWGGCTFSICIPQTQTSLQRVCKLLYIQKLYIKVLRIYLPSNIDLLQ